MPVDYYKGFLITRTARESYRKQFSSGSVHRSIDRAEVLSEPETWSHLGRVPDVAAVLRDPETGAVFLVQEPRPSRHVIITTLRSR